MKKPTMKQNVMIANIIMCLGGLLTLIDMLRFNGSARTWVIVVSIVLIIAGLAYRMATVKCPHCGQAVTGRYRLPDVCPNCGHSLTDCSE